MPNDNSSQRSENIPVAQGKISVIELRKQIDDNQFAYAMAALQAKERDREKIREHDLATQKSVLKFFGGLGALVLIVTIAAFFLNKEQFLLDCLKYIFVGSGGYGLGYFFGYKRREQG